MKLNPIFESSARRRMRMGKTPVILTAYLAAMLVFAVCELSAFFGQGVGVAKMRTGIEGYIWMTAIQFLLIILVAPALSAGSIAGERERQTFDLLLVTGVGTRRMVLGKLTENLAFLVLMILCSAPVMSLVLVTGGVSAADVLATLLYLAVIALAALSVGMVMSAIFRRTLVAVIASYLAIFAIGAGTWALAKHGPIAAAYTYDGLNHLASAGTPAAIRSLPVTILLNPAVGLVMLLAGQTGILHRTMQTTMRLYDIYTVSGYAGFTPVAWVILGAMLAAALLMTALACLILHLQTGAASRRR